MRLNLILAIPQNSPELIVSSMSVRIRLAMEGALLNKSHFAGDELHSSLHKKPETFSVQKVPEFLANLLLRAC